MSHGEFLTVRLSLGRLGCLILGEVSTLETVGPVNLLGPGELLLGRVAVVHADGDLIALDKEVEAHARVTVLVAEHLEDHLVPCAALRSGGVQRPKEVALSLLARRKEERYPASLHVLIVFVLDIR